MKSRKRRKSRKYRKSREKTESRKSKKRSLNNYFSGLTCKDKFIASPLRLGTISSFPYISKMTSILEQTPEPFHTKIY